MTHMRLMLVGVVALLGGTAWGAEPVRIAVFHEGELLGSEAKTIAELEKQLDKRKAGPVKVGDATTAEVAVARAFLLAAPPAPPPMPDAWKSAPAVVVLHVLSPSGAKPNRVSRGLGGILLFRPPRVEPVFVERIDGNADAPLRGDGLADWLARAIALAKSP
jgi:hypothetical protein